MILTRNGDDAHDPLPYFAELTNGVPLDLLLNQSWDTNRLHQRWLLPKLWALRLVENMRHTADQCMQNYYYYYNTPWERFRISTTHNNLAHQCCNSSWCDLPFCNNGCQWFSTNLSQISSIVPSLSLKALSFSVLSLLSLSLSQWTREVKIVLVQIEKLLCNRTSK